VRPDRQIFEWIVLADEVHVNLFVVKSERNDAGTPSLSAVSRVPSARFYRSRTSWKSMTPFNIFQATFIPPGALGATRCYLWHFVLLLIKPVSVIVKIHKRLYDIVSSVLYISFMSGYFICFHEQ